MSNSAVFTNPTGTPSIVRSEYALIPQNKILDSLAHSNSDLDLVFDDGDNGLRIKYNDLFISHLSEDTRLLLTPATSKALDILAERMLETRSPNVSITLAEFMEARGLKDKATAIKQIKDAIEFAYTASIKYAKELSRSERTAYKNRGILNAYEAEFRIITFRAESNRAGYYVSFSPIYASLVCAWSGMLYHRELARTNDRKNPAAYYLGRKFSERLHICLQGEEKRAKEEKREPIYSPVVRLAISTLLLTASGVIPTEDSLRSKHCRKFKQFIIEPLERDLTSLSNIGSWCYLDPETKEPLSAEAVAALSFAEWKNLVVQFTFKGYLEEIKRREALAMRPVISDTSVQNLTEK